MKLLNFRVEGRDSFGVLGSRGVMDLGARLRGGATDVVSFLRAGLIGPAQRIVASMDAGRLRAART